MELRIERLLLLPAVTLGSLFVDGVWECFTKEPEVRADGVFIAAESALPIGPYTVSLQPSRRFNRVVPLLVSAQLIGGGGLRYALGMRVIPGHYTLDAEAGIVVGQEQGPKDVHRTRFAFEALLVKLEAAKSRCEAIDLEITSPLR